MTMLPGPTGLPGKQRNRLGHGADRWINAYGDPQPRRRKEDKQSLAREQRAERLASIAFFALIALLLGAWVFGTWLGGRL